MARQDPAAKARARAQLKMRQDIPIDTTGMDPEMKATITAEQKRAHTVRKAFNPFASIGAAIGRLMKPKPKPK